jgi:hypothetical protein
MLGKEEKTCVLTGSRPSVHNYLSIRDNRNVRTILNELHYFLSASRHRSPSRFGFRILLDPHDRVSVRDESDLSKAFSFAAGDGITLRSQLHHVGFIHEGLAPH